MQKQFQPNTGLFQHIFLHFLRVAFLMEIPELYEGDFKINIATMKGGSQASVFKSNHHLYGYVHSLFIPIFQKCRY